MKKLKTATGRWELFQSQQELADLEADSDSMNRTQTL